MSRMLNEILLTNRCPGIRVYVYDVNSGRLIDVPEATGAGGAG